MKITRRAFLAAGAALATTGAAVRTDDVRVIPSSGTTLPVIGLGSWITFNVGDARDALRRSAAVIGAFVEEGGGMIDSSPMYGSSQDTIGDALTGLGRPKGVFHADKVWTPFQGSGPEQIVGSAGKWGIERFDLLQVHNLRNWRGHLDTLFAMKSEGSLTYVGVTTSHGRRHELLEEVMRDHPIDFVQLTYNPVDRAAEARLLPLARERGIAVIVNRPFQGGALPARLAGRRPPAIAAEIGAETWAQLALSFIVSHPAVTVAIPATTQVDHMRENKAAGRLPMIDAKMREAIVKSIRDA